MDRPLQIEYCGPMILPTGYAEAARSHAKALKSVGAVVVAKMNSQIHPDLKNELIRDDHEVNQFLDPAFTPPDFKPDATIWHVTPDALPHDLPKDRKNILYSVWEAIGLPRGWADHVNRADGLLTVSEFSKRLFLDGGVTVPIEVAPHPIDLDRFHPQAESARHVFPDRIETVFLVVAQWMFRKGTEDVLTAYWSEFKPDEPVALALLIWRGSHRWSEVQRVKRHIEAIKNGLNLEGYATAWYIRDKIDPADLPKWYRAADVYVTASRGESFNLGVFEAAACGVPTISTGFGGQWDYLTDETSWRVPYTLETVHGSGPSWKHYSAEQRWGRIHIDALRQAMREAHEDRELRKRKGAASFEVVAEKLTYATAGRATLEGIGKILAARA